MPPTAQDPYWYVVNQDGDPVQAYDTEQEANAALPELESQAVEVPEQTYDDNDYGTMYKESRIEKMERLLKEAEELMKELGSNYPAGADSDPSAPWNQSDPSPAVPSPKQAFTLVDSNPECVIVKHGGDLYAMSLEALTRDQVQQIAIDHVGVPTDISHDEDGAYSDPDASYYTSASHLPAEAIVDHINHNLSGLKIGNGLEDWENGMHDLVKIDEPLAQELRTTYGGLNVPY